jgi:hypothetical protein
MSAPSGNRYWTHRTTHGRNSLFAGPMFVWEACCEYFDWVHENPIKVPEVVTSGGVTTTLLIRKHRAMSVTGLCLFLGIGRSTWFAYRRRKDFVHVCMAVQNVIWVHNFELAVVGLLNPRVVARRPTSPFERGVLGC